MEDASSSAESSIAERASLEGERKQVTVMFVDIARSMELTQMLDEERWGATLDRFLTVASNAVEEFGGTTSHFTGDGLMAVFGAPLAQEDHASRACLAALRVHDRVAPLARELAQSDGVAFAIRCGLNSGEAVVGPIGDGLRTDLASVGAVSGIGQRMEGLAPQDSTALSASTAALVEGEFELRDLGKLEVKGMREPQRAYQLLGRGPARARPGADRAKRLSRFVGRETERMRLEAALEDVLAGNGRAIGICGEPGVGKSRLLHEFTRDCRERGLRVDFARGFSHGNETPLLPVLELLRSFFGIKEGVDPDEASDRVGAAVLDLDPTLDAELPLLLDFLGLPTGGESSDPIEPEARQRRLIAAVGQIAGARARREPGVIAIEDLHWIDAASATFVEELSRSATRSGALLVVTFRPEHKEHWSGDHAREKLDLAPLDARASGELLEELVGSDPSLGELTELVKARTQGNPFFIEEVVQALVEAESIVGERGAHRLAEAGETLVLPSTVKVALGARIDRLGSREKEVLQMMSVIGKDVDLAVLQEVSDLPATEMTDAIYALAAAEFIVEERTDADYILAFKHPLTQEVAYASQLSESRRLVHSEVAEAIESVHGDRLEELAAVLARHCEGAGEWLAAARWHARAAVWAWISSPEAGLRHWRRVRELCGEIGDSEEAEQLGMAARASVLAVSWRLGVPHEEAAAAHAEGWSRLRGRDPSFEGVLLDVAYSAHLCLGERQLEGIELARRASAAAEEIGDPGLVLNANCSTALCAWIVGSLQESADLADRALSLAGDDLRAGAGLVVTTPYPHCLWIRGCAETGLGLFDRAERDVARSLEVATALGDPLCELSALGTRGFLRAHMLEPERGALDAEQAVEAADRIGDNQTRVSLRCALAYALSRGESYRAARTNAEEALALMDECGAGWVWRADTLATLAVAKQGMGELEDARAVAEEALAIAKRRSLRRTISFAQLAIAQVLIAAGGALGGRGAIESALKGASEMAAQIGYRALEPQIRQERAALARLYGDRDAAAREEAEAERIVAGLKARDGG